MKKILSIFTKTICVCLVAVVGIMGVVGIWDFIPQGVLSFQSYSPIKQHSSYSEEGLLRLNGTDNLQKIDVKMVERKTLIPSGQPFGIKMFTDGVMVVGMSNIYTPEGLVNPAKESGIKTGDIITAINGERILLNEQVEKIVKNNGSTPIKVDFIRNGENKTATINPALSQEDRNYKIGIWVRDSSAGIGTMTFVDPKDNSFGGLGHGVCDIDTEQLMPLYSGEIADVIITGVKKGESGNPGELKGIFVSTKSCGEVSENCESGVYGTVSKKMPSNQPLPIAFKNEIHTGKAKILTTISGTEPKAYDVLIEKISGTSSVKNMVVKVTDAELLEKSGGIVQGMSGSPIIQDGKIIGAVTHVFVNDPTRGYGIFIENMISENRKIA